MLSSIDEQNKRMVGQGVTALFNVMLNVLLIPTLGFVGAAVSTLITEIFLFVIYYWFVTKSLKFNVIQNIVKTR